MYKIEVSPGELCDKLSILKIKLEKITDTNDLTFVQKEYNLLNNHNVLNNIEVVTLYNELYNINKQLWDLENKVRKCEYDQTFGTEFCNTARSIFRLNDKRALLKKQINILLNSNLQEVKQHN